MSENSNPDVDVQHCVETCKNLWALQQNKTLCDISMVTSKGHKQNVHRLLLASSSSYLSQLIASQPELQILYIDDALSSDALNVLVSYLYTGYLTVTDENVDQLRCISEKWQLKLAVKLCQEYLSRRSTNDEDKNEQRCLENSTKCESVCSTGTLDDSLESCTEQKSTLTLMQRAKKGKVKSAKPRIRLSFPSYRQTRSMSKQEGTDISIEQSEPGQVSGILPVNKCLMVAASVTTSESDDDGLPVPQSSRNISTLQHKTEHKSDDCQSSEQHCQQYSQPEYLQKDHIGQQASSDSTKAETKVKHYKYCCEDCNKEFTKKTTLQYHRFTNHWREGLEEPKFFYCKEKDCKFKTLYIHYLRKHMTWSHNPAKPVMCDLCGAMSKNEYYLKYHMKRKHPDGKGSQLRCSQCDVVLKSKSALRFHHKRFHVGSPDFLCTECPHTTFSKTDLDRHMFTTHNVPFPSGHQGFTCPHCNYRCARKKTMTEHITRHTATEKRYVCQICKKTFFTDSDLKKHCRTHDAERKKLKCSYCSYMCAYGPGKLQQHIQIMHENKDHKPWACHLCDYRTNVKGNLTLHRRKVHKEEVATRKHHLPRIHSSVISQSVQSPQDPQPPDSSLSKQQESAKVSVQNLSQDSRFQAEGNTLVSDSCPNFEQLNEAHTNGAVSEYLPPGEFFPSDTGPPIQTQGLEGDCCSLVTPDGVPVSQMLSTDFSYYPISQIK